MIIDSLNPTSFRYERKFLVSQLNRHEVESIIRLHPASFSEIFHPRYVNNIYFDTVDMSAYQDNSIGISDRMKVRIRWYDEIFGIIKEPVLELKTKRGLLGSKKRFPLSSFYLDSSYSLKSQKGIFSESDIPEILRDYLKSLKLALLNRYHRKYFQSTDKRFRITIDFNMEFYRLDPANNSFLEKVADRTNTILELKYSDEDDEEARFITNSFPFRMTKSSKYVTGIEDLYADML
ncbi:polyphosphate polymerase domain-containing protein [Chloroflexota bacterium]